MLICTCTQLPSVARKILNTQTKFDTCWFVFNLTWHLCSCHYSSDLLHLLPELPANQSHTLTQQNYLSRQTEENCIGKKGTVVYCRPPIKTYWTGHSSCNYKRPSDSLNTLKSSANNCLLQGYFVFIFCPPFMKPGHPYSTYLTWSVDLSHWEFPLSQKCLLNSSLFILSNLL